MANLKSRPEIDAETSGPVRPRFGGSFTQQEALPPEAVEAALAVLATSRLHRYNLAPGEAGDVALLEAEVAAWQGREFCLAVGSGGQAIQIALRAAGVGPGDKVLANAFTLAPVPGAIAATGATAVLVETDENLRIDFDDLADKAESTGARTLLISHMRGHICDMDRLVRLCRALGLTVIEDCAHSMGARWNGVRSGNHGVAACFSTQTYKHMNSGEGGFLVSDDPALMARATILSGSYMHYAKHGAGPDEAEFLKIREYMPNLSARMDALRAAILRPQLPLVDVNVGRWNRLHDIVAARLKGVPGIVLPQTASAELRVASSLQFRLPAFDAEACRQVVAEALASGVELKWFGAPEPHGFTSTHRTWRYLPEQDLPQTDRVLATLFDMRLPLTFSDADCALIGDILCDVIASIA